MSEGAMARFNQAIFRLTCLAILVFLMIPTLLVAPMSVSRDPYLRFPPDSFTLKWYAAYVLDPDWQQATLFSLEIAALTTICAVLVGSAAAVSLTRGLLPGREAIHALMLVPLIIPPIVFAIAIYLQFAPLHLIGSIPGFVLAHSVLAVPFVVIIVSAALERLDPSLEMAALNLGASRARAFIFITLPLIRPAIAAGTVFAFLSSFDEAVVSFFISGVENKTITRKLFEDIDFNLSPVIAAVSTLFVVVTAGLAWGASLLRRREQGSATVPGTR
jgi:mannopine transport system permease protein